MLVGIEFIDLTEIEFAAKSIIVFVFKLGPFQLLNNHTVARKDVTEKSWKRTDLVLYFYVTLCSEVLHKE